MTDRHIEIRTELAASKSTRVDIGEDGVLHVLAGPITLHLDRATCEELTTTLARAMVTLARSRRPRLRLIADGASSPTPAPGSEEPVAAAPGSESAGQRGSERP